MPKHELVVAARPSRLPVPIDVVRVADVAVRPGRSRPAARERRPGTVGDRRGLV